MPKPVVMQICNISRWVSQLNMLMHLNASPKKPSRIILLGGNGFIGQSLIAIIIEYIGLLNNAIGRLGFFEGKEQHVVKQFQCEVDICETPRANLIIYGHYDTTNLLKAFPTFSLTKIEDGIESYQQGSNFSG